MKKLGTLLVGASLAFAAPVFACPHHEEAPKTADKPKAPEEKPAEKAPAPAQEQPKDKPAETAKARTKEQPKAKAKEEPKKTEKVSQK